jgi:hypothetical protein
MNFKKTASVDILGVGNDSLWKRSASSQKTSSFFMEAGVLDIESALDSVADAYKISRDPRGYLLIPARACSADRPNENSDAFRREELLRFDPRVGRRVYSTFLLKPHFVNHQASNYSLSRGVLLDVHFNDQNAADDSVKRAVNAATGRDASADEFVEVLIAMDTTKDPALAEAYRSGAVYRFSMGCDVESTECSICGKVATTTAQFCEHVLSKHARREYPLQGGGRRRAFEWCNGTIFAELSGVDDPADKSAEVQEGILRVASSDPSLKSLTEHEIREITAYVVKHMGDMPVPLAGLINDAISKY